MKKTVSGGILLVGAIASLYLIGKGSALGGVGAEKVGAILGSPGAIPGGLPSAGTGSAKQIAAVTGYMAPGTKTAVSPEMRKEFGVGFVPSKTAYAGKQVSPTYIPEAATQAYVKTGGTGYVAPTFLGVGGRIVNGSAYIAPAGLYPKSGGLTAKGVATKKKVVARQARGFTSYTGGSKGTASAQKAAYKARSK